MRTILAEELTPGDIYVPGSVHLITRIAGQGLRKVTSIRPYVQSGYRYMAIDYEQLRADVVGCTGKGHTMYDVPVVLLEELPQDEAIMRLVKTADGEQVIFWRHGGRFYG